MGVRRSSRQRWFLGALFAVIPAVSIAATAWACVPFAALRVEPEQVQPGQEVVLTGSQFRPQTPVIIRLDTLDGRELARIPVDSPKGPFFRTAIVIPADVAPGTHVLIATQETPEWIGSPPWGIPARAVITVGSTPTPLPAPPVTPRTAELSRDSVSLGAIALVTLGVAGLSLLGFAVVALGASRRASRTPAPVPS